MKYYLIVGEASGDLHASHLMQSLKNLDSDAQFRFFGGDLMMAVGGTCVRHYRDLAYMGFIPVLLHLPAILRNMQKCKDDVLTILPPEAFAEGGTDEEAYCKHLSIGSWRDKGPKEEQYTLRYKIAWRIKACVEAVLRRFGYIMLKVN